MTELVVHLLLFVAVSSIIVVMSSFYTETSDGEALRSVPRRLVIFLISCAVVAAVMLFCEHFFASVV